MKWKTKIEIKLKESILDPQGQAVEDGLQSLGYQNVSKLSIGKYLELEIETEQGKDAVAEQVTEMCERLLANPVIEEYSFDISEVG